MIINITQFVVILVIIVLGIIIIINLFKPRHNKLLNEIELIHQLNKMKPINETKRKEECIKKLVFYRNNFPFLFNMAIPECEQELFIKDTPISSNRLLTKSMPILPDNLESYIDEKIKDLKGILIGKQQYLGHHYQVRVPKEIFPTHLHVVGKTGGGKTTFINGIIKQLIDRKECVIIFFGDPDMWRDAIMMVPPERENELILLNPADYKNPVIFNPFYLYEMERNNPVLINLKKDAIYSNLAENLETTNLQTADEILRQTVGALIHTDGTLMDVRRLLDRNKTAFRMKILPSLDSEAKNFWLNKYPTFPKGAANPILNRLGRFIGDDDSPCRNLFCHRKSTLDLEKIMDEGKMLFVNLTDSDIGPMNAKLIGQILLTHLQMLAMQRGRKFIDERSGVYVIMDEFERFIHDTKAIGRLLSQCRKFNICLFLLHQHLGQLPQTTVHDIVGNVGTSISFNISHLDAVKMANEYPIWRNGEIKNLDPTCLQCLGIGETFVHIGQFINETFFMYTYNYERNWDQDKIDRLTELSRKNWGIEPEQEKQAKFDYPEVGRVSLNDPIFEYDPAVVFGRQSTDGG